MEDKTYLEAAFEALSTTERPMSSKEISVFISEFEITRINGATPWKTINARISAEILNKKDESRFVRVGAGLFALRAWQQLPEYTVARRVINPTMETIAVVPRTTFLTLLSSRSGSSFYDVDYGDLFHEADGMRRLEAEETDEFVQIIPLFFIFDGERYLTYRRTKRLPEQRLHGTRSINFGGHLQVSDFPSLFKYQEEAVLLALQRELREELQFVPDMKAVTFFGAIHDSTNFFGRQHVGLVFQVDVSPKIQLLSNEPGFITAIEKFSRKEIESLREEFDDWTFLVLGEHGE